MAGVPSSDLIALRGFPQGINNRAAEEAVPPGALRAAKNVDIDDAGKPRRRPGAELVAPLAGLHSLWATDRFPFMLGVHDGAPVAIDHAEDVTALPLALQRPDLPMSWDYAARRVFFSNGVDHGEILTDLTVRPWAPEAPGGQPFAEAVTGSGGLAGGTYQVAITFIDAHGRESGASLPVEVVVAAGQGIRLTGFPAAHDPSTALVRVYCSRPNGDLLYAVQDLPVGLPTFVLGAHSEGALLNKLFLTPMPACSIIRAYGARLVGARGRALVWSEPFQYGLTNAHRNYSPHDGELVMIESAGDAESEGLYVATAAAGGRRAGRTYYLTGPTPTGWQRVIAHPDGVVPGSPTKLPAEALGVQASGLVPVWLTDSGQFVVGLPGGAVVQLHADRYVAPAGAEHASIALREIGGMRHLVATLSGGQVSGMAAVDIAEAEVWKDGARIG